MPQKPKRKTAENTEEDQNIDTLLRPTTWSEYIGQDHVKKNLKVIIEAARKRSEPVDHLLFYGQAGLGKTTLARLVAHEMSAPMKTTSGPAIEKTGDLAAMLSNLEANDILFIDEAHRLNRMIEEVLVSGDGVAQAAYRDRQGRGSEDRVHRSSAVHLDGGDDPGQPAFRAAAFALRRDIPPGLL